MRQTGPPCASSRAFCLQMGFFLQPNRRRLSSLTLGLTDVWPLREKDTRCLFILSAYLGKNYYVVLSEAFGFHLGEFSCGSPLVIVQGNKSPSSGKKHGGENKRLKAKRSRGDVIMGTDCILSDQREEKYFAFLKVTAKFVPKGKYGSDGSLNSLSIFC